MDLLPQLGIGEVLIAVIMGLIFGAVGAVLVGIGWLVKRRADLSQAWPMVLGRVVAAGVRLSTDSDGGASYYPEIQYAYDVGGQTYQNNRLMFGGAVGGGRAAAQRHVDRYPAGAVVQVYYNPASPHDSTLERRSGQTKFFYGLGGLFVVLGCGIAGCTAAVAGARLFTGA
jgi:hypothetical protein